jgi:hypothetical protein
MAKDLDIFKGQVGESCWGARKEASYKQKGIS